MHLPRLPFLRGRVVSVLLNRVADVVLLMVHFLVLLRGQMASVRLPVVMHFSVHVGLASFQVLRFMGGKLSFLYALRDAALLVERSSIHPVHSRRRGRSMID